MIEAWIDLMTAGRSVPSAGVRSARSSSTRAVRLHRHLRARAPDGRRRRVPQRRLELVRELGVSHGALPGRQLRLGLPLGGRRRPGATSARAGWTWPGTRWRPTSSGVDEFVALGRHAGVEPMMAVNLGTRGVAGGPRPAGVLQPSDGGTTCPTCARANGAAEPHDIRMWCLGNEMDGPWQIGHKTAAEYGRLAAETARGDAHGRPGPRAGRVRGSGVADADLRRVGARWCSNETLRAGRLHLRPRLLRGATATSASFLASAVDMDHFIDAVVATADAVGAAQAASKRIDISFDEWNVWYHQPAPSRGRTGTTGRWRPALLEDNYTVADAVVVGNLLISLLRHSDRVHLRLPGAAGQRDRADHDRAGRPGLAADHLPPLRADQSVGPGHRRRAGHRGADDRRPRSSARCP